MEWIIEPLSAFLGMDLMAADSCSGGGTQLNSCSCTGGLVVCQCSGGLVKPKETAAAS